MVTNAQVRQQLISLFGGHASATSITPQELWSRLRVPKKAWLGVDHCLEADGRLYLIFEVETLQIPERIKDAAQLARKSKRTDVIILARDKPAAKPPNPDGEDSDSPTPQVRAKDIGKSIAEECLKPENAFGLFAEGAGKLHLVFPPKFTPPVPLGPTQMEAGHIPSWLRARVVGCEGLSPTLARCLTDFNTQYENAIRKDKMRYQHEAHLLRNLAEAIADLVPRFHLPLDLLEEFRNWERSGVAKKRDHFFHTFNNFFAGLLVLGPLCRGRQDTLVPETYIRDTNRRPNLRPWEVLWPLVSLLHDPGYMTEQIASMFDYALGVRDGAIAITEISPADKERIRNLWKTQFADARRQLVHIFDVVSGHWDLTGASNGLTTSFETAMAEAYFDGTKCGHSLLSGLRVITECYNAEAVSQQNGFNQQATRKAGLIAALSMMFHDLHTREVFAEHKIPPISFELLPYAATLMFVDALQEDRRNIKDWQFPQACIFNDLQINPNPAAVHAIVDLHQIPIKYWPGKILEFESCLNWVNGASTTRFSIDYRTAQNLRLAEPPAPAVLRSRPQAAPRAMPANQSTRRRRQRCP